MSWDVKCRAKASRAFVCLRDLVFNNPILSLTIKRMVYRAIVMSVLLHGAETWTLKAEHVRHLNTFHNLCEDHPRHHQVPSVAAEADIQDPCQPFWHGLVHPRFHHGQEAAVAGSSGKNEG